MSENEYQPGADPAQGQEQDQWRITVERELTVDCTYCGHRWHQVWKPRQFMRDRGWKDHPWFLPCPRCGLQCGMADEEDEQEQAGEEQEGDPSPERTVVDSPGE